MSEVVAGTPVVGYAQSERPPIPFDPKHWVVERDVQHPQVGRVRDVYWDSICREWVMDVVLYSADGDRLGRTSPRRGGPSGFEPAVPCAFWQRVERPQFPLVRDRSGFRDWRAALTPIADRQKENQRTAASGSHAPLERRKTRCTSNS